MAELTIIIPSYNHGDFLFDRLESIYNQTYKNWEAIIIDDKSTDNSVEIIDNYIKKHPDFKIKYFLKNEINSGSGYYSWEKGISLAETQYIWIAETDDYSDFSFLEEMITVLKNNSSAAFAFCNSNYVSNDKHFLYDSSKRTAVLEVDVNKYEIFESDVLLNLFPLNTLITNGSSVVFRKPTNQIPQEIFRNKQISDLFLWTYLLNNKKFGFLNKKLNFFRRHEGSTTTKMNIFSKKTVYEEKIKYLNFFNRTDKFQNILDHYVENYVWINKKSFFKYKFLKQVKGVTSVDIKYFKTTIKLIFIKIKSVWK